MRFSLLYRPLQINQPLRESWKTNRQVALLEEIRYLFHITSSFLVQFPLFLFFLIWSSFNLSFFSKFISKNIFLIFLFFYSHFPNLINHLKPLHKQFTATPTYLIHPFYNLNIPFFNLNKTHKNMFLNVLEVSYTIKKSFSWWTIYYLFKKNSSRNPSKFFNNFKINSIVMNWPVASLRGLFKGGISV